jgi:putative ABC transport system substrate-binding protein
MRRRDVILLLGAAVTARPPAASAQRSDRVSRIGVLHVLPQQSSLGFIAFRERLGELGYVEGRNIAVEYRWSDQPERLPALAAELTASNVHVIVAADSTTTKAVRQATSDIPIVAAVLGEDPVKAGLAGSLGRPGGNVTGMSLLTLEMSGKRMELLREIVPGLTRVAVLWTRRDPFHSMLLLETDGAARDLGVSVVHIVANGAEDIEQAFDLIVKERADAVDVLQSAALFGIRRRIAELGLKHRLPIIGGEEGFVQVGGLVSYGPSTIDGWRQAAVYVAQILNGAKPADLPIQQPTKFQLVINLKTAKALGLTVPPSLLARADEVIE